MFKVLDPNNKIVSVTSTRKAAQKRADKLNAPFGDSRYIVVPVEVSSTDHKTTRITNHN